MSKEIQCKCCKEYWWEMNIHSKSGLCPNCYDYVANLEAKLAESEKQRQHLKDWLDNEILTSIDNESYYATINEYKEEVKKLKQQLHELPKKIVCEISEAIERLSWRKRIYTNWEFDKEQLYKDLDTILKKYGGEDE